MVMSRIWTGMLLISLLFAWFTGNGAALGAAVTGGAQAGVTLALSMAGSLLLWCGVGNLMEKIGLTRSLARLLKPGLRRIFPESARDEVLAQALSANICANLLGLGNAATPMGIRAAKRLSRSDTASHSLCRLLVLNTASLQLIPANVAAVRSGLGSASPFDILPAVWITSLTSAALGLGAAWILGRLWKND